MKRHGLGTSAQDAYLLRASFFAPDATQQQAEVCFRTNARETSSLTQVTPSAHTLDYSSVFCTPFARSNLVFRPNPTSECGASLSSGRRNAQQQMADMVAFTGKC